MARRTVLLIDGNNYLFRGWHACPPMKNKEGFPTHGIKGMLSIVMADIKYVKPDRVIVVFDKGGKPTWRTLAYPMYKKSEARVKSKDDQKEAFTQMKPIRQLLQAMGIRLLGKAGVEADDLIGTLAVEFEALGWDVVISSKDKDFGSLVTNQIKMLKAQTRKLIGPKEIKESFGVTPAQMVDYLMLLGDKVDNIPGVPKVGPKTASKWLSEYGTVKALCKNLDDLTPAMKAKMKEHKKNFKWTRPLLKIKIDIKHKVTLKNCAFQEPDLPRIKKLCKKYELSATFREIKETLARIHEKKQEKSRWATN